MKINFVVDDKTTVEFYGEEIETENEIAIRTEDGLIEIFGSKKELKRFANELYEKVVNN